MNTFHELFANGIEKFRGLKIERECLYTDEQTYKVLHFDFSDYDSRFDLDWYLQDQLKQQLMVNDIDFNNSVKGINSLLGYVLLKQDDSSLVLLIDEYDAPLTEVLDNKEKFKYRRDIFKSFYATIKKYNSKFRFVFITGITRYSQTSIFSAFNNLMDLTFNDQYGALLGYTQEELEFYFKDYIEAAACKLNRVFGTNDYSYELVLRMLKQNYDGYCFDEYASSFVYNPWSILNFLKQPNRGFCSYWIDTGSALPTLLVKYLDKIKGVFGNDNANKFLNVDATIKVSKDDLIQPLVDMSSESFSFEAVLYQAGYLTIKSLVDKDLFSIGLPNLEVKQAYAVAIVKYLGQQV